MIVYQVNEKGIIEYKYLQTSSHCFEGFTVVCNFRYIFLVGGSNSENQPSQEISIMTLQQP
jgi:hypothetical protein